MYCIITVTDAEEIQIAVLFATKLSQFTRSDGQTQKATTLLNICH